MLAVSFETTNAEAIPVKSLVSCANFAGTTSLGDGADQIWTYSQADGWKKYFYYKRGATAGWRAQGTSTALGDDVKVSAGTAVFFVRATGSAATTLTLSGGVVDLSSVKNVEVAAGETKLICNPWPMDIKIADFSNYYASGSVPAGTTSIGDGADQIWLYDQSTGWSKYYYYKRGANLRWCAQGSTTAVADDVVIPAGKGFFFVRATGSAQATLSFSAK